MLNIKNNSHKLDSLKNVFKELINVIDKKKELSEVLNGIIVQMEKGGKDNDSYLRQNILMMAYGFLTEEIKKYLGNKNSENGLPENLKEILLIIGVVQNSVLSDKYYNPSGVASCLNTGGDCKKIELSRTIYDCMYGEKEAPDVARAVLNFLRENKDKNFSDYELSDKMVLTLMLDLMFKRLDKLAIEDKVFLMANYFWKSLLLAEPVRPFLQSQLKEKFSIIQYVNENRILLEAILANGETEEISSGKIKIGEIVKDYLGRLGGKIQEEKTAVSFVDSLAVKGENKEKMIEVLNIAGALQQANLIDWTRGRNFTKDEQSEIDILRLFISFGMHGNLAYIVDYYKNNKNPLVPHELFLNKIKEFAGLEDEKNVQSYLRLNEILHQLKLLPENKELIVYFQHDSTFHWNEEIFK